MPEHIAVARPHYICEQSGVCSFNTPIEITDELIEHGRRAVNENVDGLTLKKASEGHPWAEEAIAKAVLRACLAFPRKDAD